MANGVVCVAASKIVDGQCCRIKILEKFKEGSQPFELSNDGVLLYLKRKYGKLKTKDEHTLAFKCYVWGGTLPIRKKTVFPTDTEGNKIPINPYGIINEKDFLKEEKRVEELRKIRDELNNIEWVGDEGRIEGDEFVRK